MESNEVIKNALQEHLKDLSREELIGIISYFASILVVVRTFSVMSNAMTDAESCEAKTDLQDIANGVASKIAGIDKSKHQDCILDRNLFDTINDHKV